VDALFSRKTVILPPICEVAFSKVTQMQTMMIELISVSKLRPYAKNARTHSKKQIRQIADSIKTFGFTNPVLIGDDDEIIVIALREDPHIYWTMMIMLGWVVGVLMQIIAGTIARMRA
jgi:hypothetical protein